MDYEQSRQLRITASLTNDKNLYIALGQVDGVSCLVDEQVMHLYVLFCLLLALLTKKIKDRILKKKQFKRIH